MAEEEATGWQDFVNKSPASAAEELKSVLERVTVISSEAYNNTRLPLAAKEDIRRCH